MRERGSLIVVSGLPGSGKTTAARKLATERPGVRFCSDEWMSTLGANVWDSELRARVEELQWAMACQVLLVGGTAIIEWGTWGREERGLADPPMKRSDVVEMYGFVQGHRPDDAERRTFDVVL